MKLSEGLILASTLPLCRRDWEQDDSGCLLTNLGKVVGVRLYKLVYMEQMMGPTCSLWPYQSLIRHFPLLAVVLSDADSTDPTLVADEIVNRFDGNSRVPGQSVDEIVSWICELEAQQQATEQPQAVEVTA